MNEETKPHEPETPQTRRPKPSYCTQNDGNCETCSLVSYGRDCMNNALDGGQDGR